MSARSALQLGVKVAAAGADAIRPRRRGVVVLAYHRVGGGSGLEIDLDPGRFADQIAELAPRAVTMTAALDALSAAPPACDPIVVTFDDGTGDIIEHALPVLVANRVPALLYLATSLVDGRRSPPAGGRPLSWSALADAVATGYLHVGSHTHGHVLLDRLPPDEARSDLDRSIGLIEERLGTRPVDFAYPKAVLASAAVEPLVRERFRSAAIAGTRSNRYGHTDPWRLNRSPVQVSDGMRWFRAKARGGMAFEDALRRRLNRVRYADATT